jgi:hypothetical protein
MENDEADEAPADGGAAAGGRGAAAGSRGAAAGGGGAAGDGGATAWKRQDPGLVGSNIPPFVKPVRSAADQGIFRAKNSFNFFCHMNTLFKI